METINGIKCPKCSSDQLTANQKGFSGGKALAGAVLTGGVGLLAGTIGSKDIIITCLACGNQFKPGEDKEAAAKRDYIKREQGKKVMTSSAYKFLAWIIVVFAGLMVVVFTVMAFTESWSWLFGSVIFGFIAFFFYAVAKMPKQ